MMDAIMYARKYLSVWSSTNMKELQQAMATLAFKSTTDCAGYKVVLLSHFFKFLTNADFVSDRTKLCVDLEQNLVLVHQSDTLFGCIHMVRK